MFCLMSHVDVFGRYAAGAVTFIRYAALIALIGGIATVITGVAWLWEGLALECVRFKHVGRVQ